jgi:hypothetical protein
VQKQKQKTKIEITHYVLNQQVMSASKKMAIIVHSLSFQYLELNAWLLDKQAHQFH